MENLGKVSYLSFLLQLALYLQLWPATGLDPGWDLQRPQRQRRPVLASHLDVSKPGGPHKNPKRILQTPMVSGIAFLAGLGSRGPRDHINIRISHSGSKDPYKGDTKNHGW